MKKINKSFLFFICLLFTTIVFGQNKVDSLLYYSKLVQHPSKDKDLVRAYVFFKKKYKEATDKGYGSSAIHALRYISSVELKQSFFEESERTSIEALKLVEKEKKSNYKKELQIGLYNHLGILYRKQKNYDKAHNLYIKSLKLSESLKDSIIIYNNIANVFKEEGNYYKSKEILVKICEKIKNVENHILRARVLDNLGVIKSKMQKEEGKEEMLLALGLRKQNNYNIGIHTSYNNLSEFYRRNLNLEKAEKYALKSLSVANEINNDGYKHKSLGLLTELSKDAYAYEYKKLNDSITEARMKSSNRFALLKYNTSKEKQKTKESQLKAEKAEKLRIIYQFLGLIILIISIGFYFYYNEKHKKNVVENVIITEGKISKTIHDVIANDVYHIMTKFQSDINTKEELLDDLEAVYERARDISRDNYMIDKDMDFEKVLGDLFSSYKNNSVNVITKNLQEIAWEKFSVQKKNILYRVLKELMTNMRKYSEASFVTIGFEQKNKVHLTYKDNGVGAVLSKKNGLINAESRIESVGGKIIFNSEPENGFIVKIVI
ncbi:tetratricopeptide repeat-containing sensor histidine kinase [Tenacibaculum sp. M341]|uniref:tetratricopeptide repeat-containing sensor histidine kinase n=1 Tax=Tenacibaculum sp. M341 TaxID=2530339 RepID=UPI00104E15C3|nr:tetratricopeptide repeat protein [Tenacibaculum sp. M341]TCI91861.1 tetratricopeptide repeat-containing sensor histidine kinase [Tenacibaculum sp. M341]